MTHLARAHAIALVGLDGVVVDVQTHIGPGIVGTTLVGLPDASLREAKERVRAALFSCGIPTLNRRVTVNLSPADLPKAGSSFDLAIAVSMLTARGNLPGGATESVVFIAELALDGSTHPVSGVLPAALAASRFGFDRVVVASDNVDEAKLVDGIQVTPCAHLQDLLLAFRSEEPWKTLNDLSVLRGDSSGGSEAPDDSDLRKSGTSPSNSFESVGEDGPWLDMSEIRGQDEAIQALTVAAVGGHHVLFHGPPGVGKTMLGRRLPGIIPPLTRDTALTVTALRSLAVGPQGPTRVSSLLTDPPLEAPHHSATLISVVGGGNPIRPGAISLAHGGVLLLDEAPEFSQRTLDALRQPLEMSSIRIHRAHSHVSFPARFQLVLTANPCSCGGDRGAPGTECKCSPLRVRQYRSRLSGPLLDRIDLQIHMSRPHRAALLADAPDSSNQTRDRVIEARERSAHRLRHTPWSMNVEVPGKYLRQADVLPRAYMSKLESAVERGILSLRGADRILRVAWSCADLEGNAAPTVDDFAMAMELRGTTNGVNSWI